MTGYVLEYRENYRGPPQFWNGASRLTRDPERAAKFASRHEAERVLDRIGPGMWRFCWRILKTGLSS